MKELVWQKFTGVTWTHQRVTLVVRPGDIFSATFDGYARVNSEQTDFILGWRKDTISGQLAARGGVELQSKLADAVDTQKLKEQIPSAGRLSPPVVIETRTDATGHWYHAGFHDPSVTRTTEQTEDEDLDIVSRCVGQILERAGADKRVSSVAIPLLGTGLFGLDPRVITREMIREVQLFAHHRSPRSHLRVEIILPQSATGLYALEAAAQHLADYSSEPPPWEPLSLGVPLLDSFEHRIAETNDPTYRAFMVCHYAEYVANIAHAVLAGAAGVEPTTGDSDRKRTLLSFGTVVGQIRRLAKEAEFRSDGGPVETWATELGSALKRKRVMRSWDELTQRRNAIAHGRGGCDPEDVLASLQKAVEPSRWKELSADVPLPVAELNPWLLGSPTRILHGISATQLEYFDPVTGATTSVGRTAESTER